MLTRTGRLLLEHIPLFIICYFTLQVMIRMITTPGAVIDESEQLLLTQHFSLGTTPSRHSIPGSRCCFSPCSVRVSWRWQC